MTRLTCVAAMVLLAAPVGAQQVTSGSGLQTGALATVFVQDDRGAETKGKLLRLDEQSILILVDGQQRRFDLEKVRRVQKRGDSLKNGAIIGAVFGAVIGGLTGGMADCRQADGHIGACGAGARIAMTLVSTGVYSAIGTGIDAAIQGRTTLYQKPVTSSGLVARGPTASLRFSVRW